MKKKLKTFVQIEDAEESKKQAAIEIEELREKTKDVFGALSSATGFDAGFDAGFGFDEPSKTEVCRVWNIFIVFFIQVQSRCTIYA